MWSVKLNVANINRLGGAYYVTDGIVPSIRKYPSISPQPTVEEKLTSHHSAAIIREKKMTDSLLFSPINQVSGISWFSSLSKLMEFRAKRMSPHSQSSLITDVVDHISKIIEMTH